MLKVDSKSHLYTFALSKKYLFLNPEFALFICKMFKKTTCLFIVCLGFIVNSPAQSIKQFLKQGFDAMNIKDYSSAAQIYNQVVLKDSSNIEYQLLFADASRLNYDNATALHWYEKIYKKDNGKTYVEVPFYIATQLKNTGKYKDAKKYFDKFYKKQRNSKDKTKKQMALKAKQEFEACEVAQILVKNPVDVKIVHLDSMVNSKVSEYAPFEYDSTLYFSSTGFLTNICAISHASNSCLAFNAICFFTLSLLLRCFL